MIQRNFDTEKMLPKSGSTHAQVFITTEASPRLVPLEVTSSKDELISLLAYLSRVQEQAVVLSDRKPSQSTVELFPESPQARNEAHANFAKALGILQKKLKAVQKLHALGTGEGDADAFANKSSGG